MVNLEEYREAAQHRLSQAAYDYYASGAHDQVTLGENQRAFERLKLHYKVLVDVSRRDTTCEVLGHRLRFPVLVAPTAFHGMADPEGEVATARAAAEAGSLMVLSTLSNQPLEQVGQAAPGRLWFQLYVYRDRQATQDLVARAEAAGAKALVLTVDAPLLGVREADVRNRFRLPQGLQVVNMTASGMGDLPESQSDSGLAEYFAALLDPSLNWSDLEWLAGITRLPILVKGIVRADDALRAVQHGARGIVVSNHGGRQLDTAPATIEVLEPIAQAVQGQVALLLDGGVRRGTDIIKALALGADAVMVGRPVLWGLGAAGQEGVASVLELLRRELDLAMALCGTPTLAQITRDLLARSDE